MAKGFSINDILETSTKPKRNIELSDYQPGSNYQSNIKLSFQSYHDLDYLSISGNSSKSSFKPIKTKYSYDASAPMRISQSPLKLDANRRDIRPGGTPGWDLQFPHNAAAAAAAQQRRVERDRIPQHKKGQVEATRKAKPRKTQTVFSAAQISELEIWYDKQNYISTEDRHALAKRLGMSSPQVKNWFQNKRNKERKMGHNPNRNNINLRPEHLDYQYLHNQSGFNVLQSYSAGGFYNRR